MKIESIEQDIIDQTDATLTKVIINQVPSHCLLTRLIIDVLGKPGIDNDLEFVGSGSQWVISWTHPQLTIEQTRELVTQAITPPSSNS